MIVYDRLWDTMRKKGITQYELINKYHVSAGQLSRFRKNQNVSSHTINTLCEILDCQTGDIMEYKKEHEEDWASSFFVSVRQNNYIENSFI